MMKVGIVNDVRVVAESLRRIVTETEGFRVAWVAHSGESALMHHREQPADIVLMDLIMPTLDGVETTEAIMKLRPCAILVVTATVTGNRELVFAAMSKGALDAVNTPDASSAEGTAALRRKLVTVSRLVKNDSARQARPGHHAQALHRPASAPETVHHHGEHGRGRASSSVSLPAVIGIGASTGGPQAIATILRALPAQLDAAIVIVQHLDPQFTPGFKSWLDRESSLPTHLAREGESLHAGGVWLAAGEDHLVVRATATGLRLHYTEAPGDTPHRPSVDVFLRSLAHLERVRRCGVLLTGMGADGAEGLLALRRAGGWTLAQDRADCVVYGMPAVALKLGAVDATTPLAAIAPELVRFAAHASTGQAQQLEGVS